jgi:hypothetical protein
MAFDASPKIGSIAPNTQKEIKASFTSDNMGIFTDKLRIRLFKSFTDVAVCKWQDLLSWIVDFYKFF